MITIAVLLLGIAGWLSGLLNPSTPAAERGGAPSQRSTQQPTASFDNGQLRSAAEAYWDRYPDIREHYYFGEHGPLGLDGARQHYLQHGRREGRIYGAPAGIDKKTADKEQPGNTP